MILTKRIHCVSDREPASFHEALTYSVNLNFDCLADGEEDGAKAALVKFTAALPDLEFHVYEVTPAGDAFQARRVGQLAVAPAQIVPGNALVTWLGKHAHGKESFWSQTPETAELIDHQDRAVEESDIRATHLLRGSHAWSAPVAHRFGLTRLLRVSAADTWFIPEQRELVVLPHMPGAIPAEPLSAIRTTDERYDVTFSFDPSLGDVVCRSNACAKKNDELPAFLTDQGYLKVNPDAENVRRLMDWFERGWAGLVSGLPAVLAGPSDLFAPSWNARPDGAVLLDVPAAAWRIVAALSAALDPLIVALMRPQASSLPHGSGAIGELLLPLVNDILDASQEVPTAMLDLTAQDVVKAIRDVLRNSPLLVSPGPLDPAKFLDSLLHVCGIQNASDTAESSLRLFHLLIAAVRTGFFVAPALAWTDVKLYAGSIDGDKA